MFRCEITFLLPLFLLGDVGGARGWVGLTFLQGRWRPVELGWLWLFEGVDRGVQVGVVGEVVGILHVEAPGVVDLLHSLLDACNNRDMVNFICLGYCFTTIYSVFLCFAFNFGLNERENFCMSWGWSLPREIFFVFI